MKYVLVSIIGLSLSLLVACGSSKSGGNKIAVTPTTTCLLPNGQQGNCDINFYGQYGYNGLTNYPYTQQGYNGYQNNFAGGLCGCPSGSRPVYNNTGGLGCMTTQYMVPGYGYNSYGWNSVGSYWYNIPQVAYQPFVSNSGSNCFNDVAYVCDVRLNNTCGGNGYCRPMTGGSAIGLCVTNPGSYNNTSYGTQGYYGGYWY